MENMIETKDVIQSFPIAGGKELVVLKNINIRIPTGKLRCSEDVPAPVKRR